MADTAQLNLPLLSPSQAQKHVTVNEALTRLDGLVQLRLKSVDQTIPPAVFSDADCYGVPVGATGDWAGREAMIAIATNGGWDFIAPRKGFRAFILDACVEAVFDGADWRLGAVSFTANGAGLNVISAEIDVAVPAGGGFSTVDVIPERALVFGATGVVTTAISGASAWQLGVAGDEQRYGSGLSISAGSWMSGPSTPTVYWAPTGLWITPEGADFAGGNLRLSVHYATLSVPNHL